MLQQSLALDSQPSEVAHTRREVPDFQSESTHACILFFMSRICLLQPNHSMGSNTALVRSDTFEHEMMVSETLSLLQTLLEEHKKSIASLLSQKQEEMKQLANIISRMNVGLAYLGRYARGCQQAIANCRQLQCHSDLLLLSSDRKQKRYKEISSVLNYLNQLFSVKLRLFIEVQTLMKRVRRVSSKQVDSFGRVFENYEVGLRLLFPSIKTFASDADQKVNRTNAMQRVRVVAVLQHTFLKGFHHIEVMCCIVFLSVLVASSPVSSSITLGVDRNQVLPGAPERFLKRMIGYQLKLSLYRNLLLRDGKEGIEGHQFDWVATLAHSLKQQVTTSFRECFLVVFAGYHRSYLARTPRSDSGNIPDRSAAALKLATAKEMDLEALSRLSYASIVSNVSAEQASKMVDQMLDALQVSLQFVQRTISRLTLCGSVVSSLLVEDLFLGIETSGNPLSTLPEQLDEVVAGLSQQLYDHLVSFAMELAEFARDQVSLLLGCGLFSANSFVLETRQLYKLCQILQHTARQHVLARLIPPLFETFLGQHEREVQQQADQIMKQIFQRQGILGFSQAASLDLISIVTCSCSNIAASLEIDQVFYHQSQEESEIIIVHPVFATALLPQWIRVLELSILLPLASQESLSMPNTLQTTVTRFFLRFLLTTVATFSSSAEFSCIFLQPGSFFGMQFQVLRQYVTSEFLKEGIDPSQILQHISTYNVSALLERGGRKSQQGVNPDSDNHDLSLAFLRVSQTLRSSPYYFLKCLEDICTFVKVNLNVTEVHAAETLESVIQDARLVAALVSKLVLQCLASKLLVGYFQTIDQFQQLVHSQNWIKAGMKPLPNSPSQYVYELKASFEFVAKRVEQAVASDNSNCEETVPYFHKALVEELATMLYAAFLAVPFCDSSGRAWMLNDVTWLMQQINDLEGGTATEEMMMESSAMRRVVVFLQAFELSAQEYKGWELKYRSIYRFTEAELALIKRPDRSAGQHRP